MSHQEIQFKEYARLYYTLHSQHRRQTNTMKQTAISTIWIHCNVKRGNKVFLKEGVDIVQKSTKNCTKGW